MLEPTKHSTLKNGELNSFRREDQQINGNLITRSFICTYDDCNKSYTRLSHLKRHEDSHENSYKCTENNCEQIFKSKFSLKKHIDNIHLKKTPKKYKCSVCDQEFNKHNWLTRHQYRHTGVKPYACSIEGCEKRFLVPSKLKRHVKVHEGYTCSKDNCGKKFPKWTLYIKHVKTSHPTIHKCQNCEKEFATSHNLKAHSQVHQLNRDVYLCPKPNCSRFYFMKRNLTHHLKAYHEMRPFVCTEEHCYKAFKSEEDMQAHASRHDPKKRNRKKKKSKPRPSFAARLAGYVPRKIIEHETEDETSEICSNASEVVDVQHTSPGEKNQDVPNVINVDNIPVYCMDKGIQIILNLKETMLEGKSSCPESIVKCVSV